MYSFRILENYSKDMFHSSILRFDKTSYLFNCCDGTQRNALDQGIKFQKIKTIFFNSSKTDCYLGTYGFLMSRGEINFTKAFATKNQNQNQEKKDKNNEKNDKNEKDNKNEEKNKSKKKNKSPDRKIIKPILNKMGSETKNPFEDIQQCTLYGPPNFSLNFMHSKNFCPVPINRYLYEYDTTSQEFICRNIFGEKNPHMH